MTRILPTKRKSLVSAAVVASVTVATLGLSVGSAFAAAPTAITSSQSGATVYTTAATQVLNYSIGAGNMAAIKFAIVAGANVDPAANGNNASDGNCTVPDAGGLGTCTVPLANTGSSTVTIFADLNTDGIITAGEPTVNDTVVKSGAVFSVTLDTHAVGTSAGTPVTFKATAKDAAGNPVPGTTIRITATQAVSTATNPLTITPVGTLSGASGAWQADSSVVASSTTGAEGTASFTVASSAPGSVLVRAYSGGAVYAAGNPNDTATITVVAGGNAGVTTVAFTAATGTAYTGTNQTFTAILTGSGGVPISGVVANYVITGANPSSGTLPASDAAGKTTLTYTAVNNGVDNILVYVNTPSGTTPGRDAGEPGANATRTTATPPAYTDIIGTCVQQLAGATKGMSINPNLGVDCEQPLDMTSATFTYKVVNGTTPVAGVVLSFNEYSSGTVGTVTWSATTCTTSVAGTCSITGTASAPVNNGYIEADPSIGTGAVPANGYDWVVFKTRVPAATIAPMDQAVNFHGVATVTVNVADQFGKVSAALPVSFGVTGTNAVSTTTKNTDSSGNVTFSYTDASASTTEGRVDTVAVTVNSVTTNVPVHFFSNAAAGSVTLDVLAPFDFAAGSNTGAVNLSTTNSVSLIVKNAAGLPLAGKTVKVTVSGVGSLAAGGNTTSVITNGSGVATVSVLSDKSGGQLITAVADGITATGTLTYGAPAVTSARYIKVYPITDATVAIAAGDVKTLRFQVTDRFGNGVPGVTVSLNNTGAGFFFGGTNSATAVTGSDGVVAVVVSSLATTYGGSTVTATIVPGAPLTDIGTVSGLADAQLSTTAAVQYSPLPTIGGPTFRTGAGSVTITGVVAPNVSVSLLVGGVQVATTTSSATGVYTFVRTINISTYFAVKAGGLTSTLFKVSVKFGVKVYLKNRVIGKILITVPTYPHVSNIQVRFYMIVGGTYRYLGYARTGATGFAGFNVKVARHTTYTFTARAVGGAGRLGSALAVRQSIRSL